MTRQIPWLRVFVEGVVIVGSMKSCNKTCIIAGQRWRAPTSAESAKTPYFQRSRAPTSARLISDKPPQPLRIGDSDLQEVTVLTGDVVQLLHLG